MMPKIKRTDMAIIFVCVLMIIVLGACAPRTIPSGDFCDIYEPVIFVSGEGVSAAIDGESDLLDRSAVSQILVLNEYEDRHCGE